MRVLFLSLFAFCTTVSTATAIETPPIAPGLWEVTSNSQGQTTKSKHCLDKDTMEKMLAQSTKMLGATCSQLSMKKNSATSYSSSVNCEMMGSKISVSSILSGDFENQYTSTTTTSFNPPMMGQTGGVSKDSAKRLGECPATMQPGDIVLSDGRSVNAQKMMENMPNIGDMMQQLESGQAPNPEKMQQLMQQMQKMQQQNNQ